MNKLLASRVLSPTTWGEMAYALLQDVASEPWQLRMLDHYRRDLQDPAPEDRARALSVILAILLHQPGSGSGEGAMT